MFDERNADREALIYNLRVFDVITNRVIGYVEDISVSGARLLSEEPIAAKKMSRYRLELPKFYEGKRSVEFSAVTTWSQGDDCNRNFCDCGVRFVDLDPLERERISQLIGAFHI